VETIREAGATFRSLSEPWADTTPHGGKFILTVFAGMAEFEREFIHERTCMALARRYLWAQVHFYTSPGTPDLVEIPRALLQRLTDTLCYAA
jgi:hypothetical protein